jgi:hypothetical protein
MSQQFLLGGLALSQLGLVREGSQLIYAFIVSHHQAGQIVTNKILGLGQIITVTIRAL